jgi:hypothetical protein
VVLAVIDLYGGHHCFVEWENVNEKEILSEILSD